MASNHPATAAVAAHDGAVHPVRPGSDRAPQARRPERQPSRKRSRDSSPASAGQQAPELRWSCRIRVVGHPRLGGRPQHRVDPTAPLPRSLSTRSWAIRGEYRQFWACALVPVMRRRLPVHASDDRERSSGLQGLCRIFLDGGGGVTVVRLRGCLRRGVLAAGGAPGKPAVSNRPDPREPRRVSVAGALFVVSSAGAGAGAGAAASVGDGGGPGRDRRGPGEDLGACRGRRGGVPGLRGLVHEGAWPVRAAAA